MMNQNAIAIVFDEQPLFANSFSVLVEGLGRFRSVHVIGEERALCQLLAHLPPHPIYLFLGYYPQGNMAFPFIHEVKRLNRKVNVIVLSSGVTPAIAANILACQPQGLISKLSGFKTIPKCLSAIDRGEQYLCPFVAKLAMDTTSRGKLFLTYRELVILQYFAKGLSVNQTAEQTHLSKHTIVAHRRNMMAKANVHSIMELLEYARKKGFI